MKNIDDLIICNMYFLSTLYIFKLTLGISNVNKNFQEFIPAGYVLDTVEVLDAEGNAVELDGLKFAIPAGGVTVNATFMLAE